MCPRASREGTRPRAPSGERVNPASGRRPRSTADLLVGGLGLRRSPLGAKLGKPSEPKFRVAYRSAPRIAGVRVSRGAARSVRTCSASLSRPPASKDIVFATFACVFISLAGRFAIEGGRFANEGGQLPIEGGRFTTEGGRLTIEGGRLPIEGGQLTSDGETGKRKQDKTSLGSGFWTGHR